MAKIFRLWSILILGYPTHCFPISSPCERDGCRCVNVNVNGDEASCCCFGRALDQIPLHLWRNVTKLTMRQVGISRIRDTDFQSYTLLTHLEISEANYLTTVDAAAFAPLTRLKKLSINNCPRLERVDGYLLKKNAELLTLEIKKTGLTRIPKLKNVTKTLSPPDVDFSENDINDIETGDVEGIVVSVLRLSRNRIDRIADFAFASSKIYLLAMDNNPLTRVSSHAFSGISTLTKLDLSYTNLRQLPEEGLSEVEELSVEHTPTLKQLPPLIAFVNLKVARLTYPYHCCLFKRNVTKDWKVHAKKYEGNLQELREKHCFPTSSLASITSVPATKSPPLLSSLAPQGTTERHRKRSTGKALDQSNRRKNPNAHISSNANSLGDCVNDLRCNGASAVVPRDGYGHQAGNGSLGSQLVQKTSRRRRGSQWKLLGQFGPFDEEGGETVEEELSLTDELETSPAALFGEPLDQRGRVEGASYTAPRANGFSWGKTIKESKRVDKTEGGGRSRGDAVASVPFHAGAWELAPVTVARIVVPCVDGDRVVDEYYAKVQCFPQPDALNPCEDVMIGWHLRIVVFFVWIAATVGNVLVIVVLVLTNQPRQRVNNFLMINLAFADLCTGLYLAMLAIEDVTTKGQYYNYAVAWQTGWGCKIAGALAVFASELSIITMVMISFEVRYNTKYAIFQKRLPISIALPLMVVGWLVSGGLAVLPLVGVSDYSVTSTCLPLRLESVTDQVYLLACLGCNVIGFAFIVYNYVSVYRAVARSMAATAHAQDVALAKLMFCLIFTDFLCWAPTVFFGLTAAANLPLISISAAKVFLVVFYPLNAFANPWLYVFLTKRFRMNLSRFLRKHVWLREFIYGLLRRQPQSQHSAAASNNYYYHSQPHSPTQTTNLTSQRSSPSTCSSVLITPRGSRASLPTVELTPRGGSGESCNDASNSDETSALLAQFDSNGGSAVNNANVTVVARRKSATQKFRPQMSDIFEHSNSNSAEDDPKPRTRSRQPSGSQSPYQRSLSTLIGRRRRRSADDRKNSATELHLCGYELKLDSNLGPTPSSTPIDQYTPIQRTASANGLLCDGNKNNAVSDKRKLHVLFY